MGKREVKVLWEAGACLPIFSGEGKQVKRVETRHFHHPFRMDKHIKQVILVNILLGTKPKALEPRPVGILIPKLTKERLLQFSLCVVPHLG